MAERMLFGLIGFPLEHSDSPAWFKEKFRSDGIQDAEYALFPLSSPAQFIPLLRNTPDLAGLNVTIPYKEAILPYLDELDEVAREIGAVNTVKITREENVIRTKGFNTDAPGFLGTVADQAITGPALILGTGGGAKAVAFALKTLDISFRFVSRAPREEGTISYEDLDAGMIGSHRLIVNTTPQGMYPRIHTFPPIPYQYLTSDHLLYDLVYNPGETEFIKRGKAYNARTMNGREMLTRQAELAYKIFLGY